VCVNQTVILVIKMIRSDAKAARIFVSKISHKVPTFRNSSE
jgi:hypothetical protein